MYQNYEFIRDSNSPYADNEGRVFIHRKVASEMLGRELDEFEVVHHKDGDTHNNSPDNLMVFATQEDHARYHAGGDAILEGDHYICVYDWESKKINICPTCGKKCIGIYCSNKCRGISKQIINWNKEELENDLISYHSILQIAKKYNVSDNCIRKHLKQYGLPYKKYDITIYKNEKIHKE